MKKIENRISLFFSLCIYIGCAHTVMGTSQLWDEFPLVRSKRNDA